MAAFVAGAVVAGAVVASVGCGVGATVGGAVGTGVGCAVRTVGTGVGATVGCGVTAALTMTVPLMVDGWNAQTYAKVPAMLNVIVFAPPLGASACVSNEPPVALALCCVGSRFVHVTLSPTVTVTVCGENAKVWIVTGLVIACGDAIAGDVMPTSSSANAAMNSRTPRVASRIRYG